MILHARALLRSLVVLSVGLSLPASAQFEARLSTQLRGARASGRGDDDRLRGRPPGPPGARRRGLGRRSPPDARRPGGVTVPVRGSHPRYPPRRRPRARPLAEGDAVRRGARAARVRPAARLREQRAPQRERLRRARAARPRAVAGLARDPERAGDERAHPRAGAQVRAFRRGRVPDPVRAARRRDGGLLLTGASTPASPRRGSSGRARARPGSPPGSSTRAATRSLRWWTSSATGR